MKTLQKTILALAVTFTTTYSFAQTAYEKAMLPKVQTIEMPKANLDDYTAQANDFARIGDKEKTLWQPYYYAALSIIKKGRELMQKNQVAQLDDVAVLYFLSQQNRFLYHHSPVNSFINFIHVCYYLFYIQTFKAL